MIDLFAFWLGATAHQLIDPLSILLGIAAGILARRWLYLIALCVIAGFVYRLGVFAVNANARAEPFFTMQFAAAAGAAGFIGTVVYSFRKWRRRAQLASSSSSA